MAVVCPRKHFTAVTANQIGVEKFEQLRVDFGAAEVSGIFFFSFLLINIYTSKFCHFLLTLFILPKEDIQTRSSYPVVFLHKCSAMSGDLLRVFFSIYFPYTSLQNKSN